MTDNLLKDQNNFNLSIPTHFVDTAAGDFSYNYTSLIEYFAGLGDLKVALSGEIDQTALDNGINTHKFAYIKSVRTSLWSTLNKLGYAQNDSTYFNFLAVTNRVDSILNDGTVIDVPVLFLGSSSGDPAKITINGGTVELKGQTIIDSDHVPNIEIDINDSSTFTIDKAFKIAGTFNIDGGNFIFKGDAPDTDTSIVLTKTDGSQATYQINKDEVIYNNGNSIGVTYNEENITNSTINLSNGSISTGTNGVIFLDHHNQLNLSGNSSIGGNIVLGWDQNAINVNGSFVMRTGSDILYSGSIDFKNYGFSGPGTMSIFGQYWDGKEFKLSQASVDGGTLGNLNVGYDRYNIVGLGGLDTTSDPNAPTNSNVLYGGSLTISGDTTLEGTVTANGGTSEYASTITLKDGTTITLTDNSRGFVIGNNYSYFIVGNSVNFGNLDLQKGTVTLGDNDSFTTLTTEGGTLTAASGTVTGTNLKETGGTVTFDNLIINKNIDISNGKFEANNLQCKQGELSVENGGNVQIKNGSLDDVECIIDGNIDLKNTTMNTLFIGSQSQGFLSDCSINQNLNITYNSQVTVTGNLNYAGSEMTTYGGDLTAPLLLLKNATVDFTNSKCFLGVSFKIDLGQNTTFQVNNNNELVINDESSKIDGILNLTGSGTVINSETFTGNGSINVNSGVTFDLSTSSSTKPTINLNDGSTLEIADSRSITTADINFVNKTSDQITTIQFDDTLWNQNSTIDRIINNAGTSDRIDFKGINFTNETFKDAVYNGGKLTVDYTDNGTTTTHEIILNNITSKIFTDGEQFTIVNDGNGGSEIDFSTGHTSLNHNPLHSMFNAGNDNYALNHGMSNGNLTNTPNPHTALMKDFSSTLNHIKGMFEPTSLNVTHNQFDQPTSLLGSDMLFKGQMNTHRELLSHVGKVCA